MKRVMAAAILALALPDSADAQNWSGFYAGATGGYGWGTSAQTGLVPIAAPPVLILDDAKFSTSGGLFGGGLGWNWQYGAWVIGVEGDYSYAAVKGHSDFCGNLPNSCGSRLESLGTVRGRLGSVVNNNWLLYATGGWAFGEVSGFSTAKTSGDAMYSGWTVGAGIETRFAPQWSLKLEYLYTDLGNKDLYEATVPGFPENVAYKVNSVRLGISYSFTPYVAPAPMITKGPPLK